MIVKLVLDGHPELASQSSENKTPGFPVLHVTPLGTGGGYKHASQLLQHTAGSVMLLEPTDKTLLVYVVLPFVQMVIQHILTEFYQLVQVT